MPPLSTAPGWKHGRPGMDGRVRGNEAMRPCQHGTGCLTPNRPTDSIERIAGGQAFERTMWGLLALSIFRRSCRESVHPCQMNRPRTVDDSHRAMMTSWLLNHDLAGQPAT